MRKRSRMFQPVVLIQILAVLVVCGLFLAACGADDPALLFDVCGTGGLYCPNSGQCCPNGYEYYCAVKTDGTGDGCFDVHPGADCASSVEVCS